MGETKSFTKEQLQRLSDAAEIRIEAMEGGRRHSTIVWVVVDGDAVFVRSYLGARGRWYQRVRRDGRAVIRVDALAIPVRADPEADPEVNRRVDEAYRPKYGRRWPADTAQTTLRLLPA